ncbi:hypothetical protein ASD52_31485 [Ensifer sp. Root142]|nr:hypothetical protein ASD52_31485 [Ensifer sp. Root142]OMQ42432.1 hypothetical protein BKP54_24040 [Ensifer sp. 1H6]PSS62880.1 hypothetical protein C6558_20900 [Ensifer sp. NM-2]
MAHHLLSETAAYITFAPSQEAPSSAREVDVAYIDGRQQRIFDDAIIRAPQEGTAPRREPDAVRLIVVVDALRQDADGYAIRFSVDCVPEYGLAEGYNGSGLPACSCTM